MIGAVLAIVWLLTGTSGGVIGRAFLTLAVLVGFAFAVLGEAALVDRRHPFVTLIRILILAATVGSALWLAWGDDAGWWRYAEGWAKLFGWLAVVAVLQAAAGLVSLAGWWVTTRSPGRGWSATMLAGSVLALGAFVMLAVPCTFQELRPDDFYWRLVAAFGIAAAACVIVPLTAIAMIRPKADRPPHASEGAGPEAGSGSAFTAPPATTLSPAAPALAAPPTAYPSPAPPSALSIVGFVLAIVLAPAGLVVSIVALVNARRTDRQSGFAIAGIVVGGIFTAFWILIASLTISFAAQDYRYSDGGDRYAAAVHGPGHEPSW